MRVNLNNDHNHTTKRFKRSLSEAFPSDARSAIAIEVHKPKDPAWLIWTILIVCLVGVTVITQKHKETSIEESIIYQTGTASKMQMSATKACEQVGTVVWIDLDTMICLSEKP